MVMMSLQRWAARSMPLLLGSALLSRGAVVVAFGSESITRPPRAVAPALRAFYSTTSCRLSATSSNNEDNESTTSTAPSSGGKVPITLLSGFLGTGKTSTLQHLLENKENLKIGVVVNDVASVNIDRKLIAAGAASSDLVELQNGCACCSLRDELLFSIEKLLTGRKLDSIVVELSGVADPAAVKYNFEETGNGLDAEISRVVTVIDAASFGTDYLSWDLAQERDQWVAPGDDCTGQRKVSELLAEQCEAADLILVNKMDLLNEDERQLQVATGVARALNNKAELVAVEFGRVAPRRILGPAIASKASKGSDVRQLPSNDEDDAATTCTDESHSHSHHDHHSAKTSTDDLGISNFVYKATRPFNVIRLMKVLNQWPVPIKDTLDIAVLQDATTAFPETDAESPFVGVIRSKGFCWFAPQKWTGAGQDAWRHDTAMYWSHAGRHFGISAAGKVRFCFFFVFVGCMVSISSFSPHLST